MSAVFSTKARHSPILRREEVQAAVKLDATEDTDFLMFSKSPMETKVMTPQKVTLKNCTSVMQAACCMWMRRYLLSI